MNPVQSAVGPNQHGSKNGEPHTAGNTDGSVPQHLDSVLNDEMLARFASRAATYDRENRFFTEDFEELRAAKFLLLSLPVEFGGQGRVLADVCRELRRLAYYAPATALAVNMHLYWIGVAADLWRSGDTSLEWILREAAAGEIFAAGHAESGNDLPVLLSTAKAERVEGGYRITGTKQFGSLTPVWTRFGIHAMDTSNPAEPKIIHAFMAPRLFRVHDKKYLGRFRYACNSERQHGPGKCIYPGSVCRHVRFLPAAQESIASSLASLPGL